MPLSERHGVRVFTCAPDGPALGSDRDALDLMGEGWSHGAALIAIPVERLSPAFFDLKTRVAGEIVQKFATYGWRIATYGWRIAILGDISSHIAASDALRAWVAECNRGRQVWFLQSAAELDERLHDLPRYGAAGRPDTRPPRGVPGERRRAGRALRGDPGRQVWPLEGTEFAACPGTRRRDTAPTWTTSRACRGDARRGGAAAAPQEPLSSSSSSGSAATPARSSTSSATTTGTRSRTAMAMPSLGLQSTSMTPAAVAISS